MKKGLILILVMSLLACGKVDTPIVSPTVSPTPTPTSETVEKQAYDFSVVPSDTWYVENASLENNVALKTVKLTASEAASEVYLSKDAIPFKQGRDYTIRFKAKANSEREIRVFIDNGEGELLDQKTFSINEEEQLFEYFFEYRDYDTWKGRISFNLGFNDYDDIVEINEFMISPDKAFISGIRTDQIGYLKGNHKTVTFAYNQGNYFGVYNTETDELVGYYPIGNGKDDVTTGEFNFQGDFTDADSNGNYYIKTEVGTSSYPFTIGDKIYDNLLADTLKFIFLQRCGMEIDAKYSSVFAHGTCHNRPAEIYGFYTEKDASGGWHDAGDYGRYVQTNANVIADLLFAYHYNPEVFTDELNIAESGNGVPDILDEARYGLEWLFKLQKDDGSVYNKVTTEEFAGIVMPEDDTEKDYILPAWTLTTASFAGVMATASIIYQDIDSDFAQRCYDAAIKAGNHLKGNGSKVISNNPGDFNTGEYLDDNENDERFFAYAALYALTKDQSYYDLCQQIFDLNDFSPNTKTANMKLFGTYLVLEYFEKDAFRTKVYDDLIANANSSYRRNLEDAYHYPYNDFSWGSNSYVAVDISMQMMAYHFSEQDRYKQTALNELHYILGQNALGLCFVTGYGQEFPHNIHHRITMVNKSEVIGALVGGVDQIMSEGNLSYFLSDDTPIAKRYVDLVDAYSTNEVATYYNSALVFALSFFA